MVASYLSLIGLSLASPRRAARRVLDPPPRAYDGLLLAVTASCVFMAATKLLETGFGATIVDVVNAFFAYYDQRAAEEFAAGRISEMPAQTRFAPLGPFWLRVVNDLAAHVITVSIGAGAAWMIGARLEGKGSLAAMRTVFGAWLLAVLAPLTILVETLMFSTSVQMLPNIMLLGGVLNIYALYALAAFIAEAHGFKSTGKTFLALMPGALIFYLILRELEKLAGA